MSVRVRYAPSPTGLQHIGGVRMFLFNYFFARSQGGKFILRIEDTDRARFNDESLQDLYDTLSWLGIDWDEGPDKDGGFGPYIQSERLEHYTKYAEKLIAEGKAYRCFCTPERMEKLREEQKENKQDYGYDRHCRNLPEEEVQKNLDEGKPYVVRLKIPEQRDISFHDEILGKIKRKSKDISPDPVILKTDGFPTYHLASVVDDHMMEITHIFRGQEWIPSTPLHILMYEAFGWETPKFCHMPLIMGKDGKKLSKRHGSTFARDFRTMGYLPEAMVNYVIMLGWSFDDSREFFSHDDLKELFSLEKVNKAPAVFDYKKLEWFNGQYIRQADPERIQNLYLPLLKEEGIISDPPTEGEMALVKESYSLIQERLKVINDAPGLLRFLFKEIESYNVEEAIPKKMDAEGTKAILKGCLEVLEGYADRSEEENEECFKQKAEELEVKLGQIFQPLRVAVTGTKVSPPMFESINILGVDKAIERVNNLLNLM
ncbi:MAG: glutamate--tRNA ligase [Spirochaetales bacterium]|nr:glutamate--tRNA ligase [Spirochaetales bacterium]